MAIDMAEILAQHRNKTYPIQTRIGDVILRPVTKKEAQSVLSYLVTAFPEYEAKAKRYDYILKISKYPDGMRPEVVREMAELRDYMAEMMDYTAIKAFVSPVLKSPEDMWALADALSPEEWTNIQLILPTLTSQMPITDLDLEIIHLCKEYNIPLASDLTAENMTMTQAAVLRAGMVERAEATEKAMKELNES